MHGLEHAVQCLLAGGHDVKSLSKPEIEKAFWTFAFTPHNTSRPSVRSSLRDVMSRILIAALLSCPTSAQSSTSRRKPAFSEVASFASIALISSLPATLPSGASPSTSPSLNSRISMPYALNTKILPPILTLSPSRRWCSEIRSPLTNVPFGE